MNPFQDVLWAWNAFWRLSNSRPQGFGGPLRIPISEIEAYCRIYQYDRTRAQDLVFYIENMDNTYMIHVETIKEEQERKGNKPGSK